MFEKTQNELNDYWFEVQRMIDNGLTIEFQLWIKPLKPISIDKHTIYLKAPSEFHKKVVDGLTLELRYLKGMLKDITGKEYEICIIV